RLQGANIPLEGMSQLCSGLRNGELGADLARKVSVCGLPRAVDRVLKHSLTKLLAGSIAVAMQKLGDVIEIDPAGLI
ncbi:hypothetical protein KC217_24750, partial [Mycobacterium tuberculosis]|nr:hypothetical protein [Mycobacterium tuberculosis]